jgi:hypothetical protein
MKRILFLLLFVASACDAVLPTAAVGLGPNKGYVQSHAGSQVELVPMSDGTVRVYVSSEKGDPQKATGEVTMTISADAFSPTEVVLVPSEDGAYLVGTLPNVPQKSAEVSLLFPSGAKLKYSGVSLLNSGAAPVVVAGVPAGFKAPHSGTVTRVGDSLVEVAISPKGEVQVYTYTLDGALIPASKVKMSSVEVKHEGKPYKVGLKPNKGDYLTGKISGKVNIPAQAEVSIAFIEPIYIFDVMYEPAVIIFPVYIVVAPIVIVPVVLIHHGKGKHHKHHK